LHLEILEGMTIKVDIDLEPLVLIETEVEEPQSEPKMVEDPEPELKMKESGSEVVAELVLV